MKQCILAVPIIIASLCMNSCGSHKNDSVRLTHEDSLKIISDKAYQTHLAALQNQREVITGPALTGGETTISRGEKYKTYLMDEPTNGITEDFEKLKARLERAQKDSTSPYGPLLTRFRLLNSQHKYMTATYTSEAHLLRYTSQITFDDKHEEVRDFYIDSGCLVYYREYKTFTQGEQDLMTEDSYFLRDNKVSYSYRDEGDAQERRDKMDVMSMRRYTIKGDLLSHVAKEFDDFKKDYEILLTQPLEPLIYPGPQQQQ